MCCIVRPTCTTLRARAAASTLQPARCTATVYCREAFQKQPWRSGHRGSKGGTLTSWCATIVDRDWRPAHGIPSSLNLDPLPTTILHQPPIPPSPTYNMTLCSYKADRAHDPILKSVLHSPPDMHHPARTCGRKHSSASPLHGHGLLPRGLPETALEEWAPWPNPGEAHIVVCDDRRS